MCSLEGRMFPVEICYLAEATSNYVEAAVQAVMDINASVRRRHSLKALTASNRRATSSSS